VRRSDEEIAAWAAWELARSGYAWNLWDRLNLYVVEDLRAGSDVALTIERYEELATERWEPAEWKGRLCAIHAALAAAARARPARPRTPTRTSPPSPRCAPRRTSATRSLLTTSPSATSNRKDSSTPSSTATPVRARAARPRNALLQDPRRPSRAEGEDDQSARWERLALLLDDETDYSPADLDRALEPVDPEDPWGEPATESGRDYTDETTGADTDTETTEGDADTAPTTTTIPIGAVRSPTSLSSLGALTPASPHCLSDPRTASSAAATSATSTTRAPSIVGSPDARAAGWRAVVRRRCVDTRFR